jgi:hypothetical protein
VTPIEKLRRRNRFKATIGTAARDKLSGFKLFDLVGTIWSLNNRPPRRTGNEQVDFESQIEMAYLSSYEQTLTRRLLQAVIKLDAATLQEVTDIIEQLRVFTRQDWLSPAPVHRLDFAILIYTRRHTQDPTIGELMNWVSPKMGWPFDHKGRWNKDDEKQVRRHCKSLGVKIARSKPGPKSR